MTGLQGNFRIAVPGSSIQYTLTPDGAQVIDADLPDKPIDGVYWLSAPCMCPKCGHVWSVVAPWGWYGIECPSCGMLDMQYQHVRKDVDQNDIS